MSHVQVQACHLNGKGGAQTVTLDAIDAEAEQTGSGGRTKSSCLWVQLDGGKSETRKWLNAHLGQSGSHVAQALTHMETRPRMVQMGEGILLILRGANLNENAHPEDMVSIRIYADAERIITVQHRGLRAVQDIHDALETGKGPRNPAEWLAMIIERLTERMEPVLAALDDRTDHLEQKVLETGNKDLRFIIMDARRQTIIFRRYISPQREAIAALRLADLNWINDVQRRSLHESQDKVTRHVEDLDAIRERAQVIKDELANMMSDRLNRNMYVLSVIAAIFLPLGFLTGLFGINIGGMPGVDSHHAFWIFVGALAIVVATQVWIFRKLKWF